MTKRSFALQLCGVINGVAVEYGIRNLLSQIGQPTFSYRNFNHPNHGPLLAKWPLMGVIAKLPEMRAEPIGQLATEAESLLNTAKPSKNSQNTQNEKPGRQALFDKYRSEADRPAKDSGADVRSLLGRLSGVRS